jgi:hypothetical protein
LTSLPVPQHYSGALKRIARIVIALLGCLHLCGGHWGVMQVVAWSQMLVDYSSQDGLLEGAMKTFDGEHPCCMCEAIAAGKKLEAQSGQDDPKAPQVPNGLVLKECLFAPAIRVLPPPPRDCAVLKCPPTDLRGFTLGERPPVPPPRGVA